MARPASERALDSLAALLRGGARCVLLTGPPGIGKTLLARVLAQRVAAWLIVAELSYPALPAAELCAWALRELREEPGSDPEAQLLRRAGREAGAGRALLLVVDDAQSVPPDAAARLRRLSDTSRGALRLLPVATDLASALRRALAPEHEICLHEPLTREELTDYVARRLERAGAGTELRARFDAEALDRLQRDSAGIPGRVHAGATALLRGAAPHRRTVPPAPQAASAAEAPGPRTGAPSPTSTPSAPPRAHGTRRLGRTRLALAWIAAALVASGGALLLVLLVGRGAPPSSAPPRPAPPAEPPPAPRAPELPATPAPPVSPAPALVRVHLNATPWAAIEVDGSALGETPLAAVALAPGAHRFVARMADGRVLEATLEVDEAHRHLAFE